LPPTAISLSDFSHIASDHARLASLYVTLSETAKELRSAAESHNWTFDGIEILELIVDPGDLERDGQVSMLPASEVELSETTQKLVAALDRSDRLRSPRGRRAGGERGFRCSYREGGGVLRTPGSPAERPNLPGLTGPPWHKLAPRANPSPPPSTHEELIIYPKNGQVAARQAADRYDCHSWAKAQTGFDPTQVGGGGPPANAASSRSEYDSAMSACLTARGYEVR